jgi:hypothetical protein
MTVRVCVRADEFRHQKDWGDSAIDFFFAGLLSLREFNLANQWK